MATELAGKTIAFLVAEGVEQVELTEPWKAVERAGGKPELVSVDEGEVLTIRSATLLRHGERNAWVEMVIDEGRNRQIRRIVEAAGAEVLRLVRVRIGGLDLGELAKGAVRELRPDEVALPLASARG